VSTVDSEVSLCARISRRLAEQVGPERFGRVFGDGTRLTLVGDTLDLGVDSAFMADWIGRRLHDDIEAAAASEAGRPVRLRISVDPGIRDRQPRRALDSHREGTADHHPRRTPHAGESRHQVGPGARSDAGSEPRNAWRSNPVPSCRSASLDLEIGLPLDDRYRLDRFVVGQTNRMAHASATRVVVPEEQGGWKLLFLHGSCGVGKTHLLQGVARRFAEHHPGRRICYTTGERFTNQYIAALRENRIEAFRRALRRIDLLCLDDVHFLANKRATQDELLHTLKSIDLTGARLVIASDEHPQHITRIADHLVSRFMAGVVMGIDPPDEDLRQRLVDEFARRRGLQLAPAVASAVAHLPFASPRELEGAVAKVDAVHQLVMTDGGLTLNREVGMCTFRQAFPQPEPRRRGPIKVTEILDRVSARIGVEVGDVLGSSRHRRVVAARSITSFLARRLTTLSFPEIAHAMGRPNHSTIVTATRRIEDKIRESACVEIGTTGERMPYGALIDELQREIAVRGPNGRS
jgi:chromosomal replication initiator protein